MELVNFLLVCGSAVLRGQRHPGPDSGAKSEWRKPAGFHLAWNPSCTRLGAGVSWGPADRRGGQFSRGFRARLRVSLTQWWGCAAAQPSFLLPEAGRKSSLVYVLGEDSEIFCRAKGGQRPGSRGVNLEVWPLCCQGSCRAWGQESPSPGAGSVSGALGGGGDG